MRKPAFLFASLFLFSAFVLSCKEVGLPPFATDTEINQWVHEQMKLWYYWEDKIPADPDYKQSPGSFFNNILYAYDAGLRPDGDRFSWIQRNADELRSSLSGESVTYGMEYRIASVASLNKTIGTVLYVLPGSPADKAGLKRGDIFTQVNGTDLTTSNYSQLLSGTSEKKFTLAEINDETSSLDSAGTAAVTPVKFQEDPVHYHTVKTNGGKKIGYLVYHQFYPSTNGTNDRKYDSKLETVFGEFKQQQVNELIVDLRYNSGGYVSSAVLLASLIARDVTTRDVFSIKEYNPEITGILRKKYGDDYFQDRFASKTQNIGSQIDRVYILTSRRTASASELLINGLLPYLPVTVVGETTVGKNVGSVTISDDEKRTNWGLQPIVSKSFNSLRESNYTSGFSPDFPAAESLRIYPYGDERDPLLAAALTAITGTDVASAARKADTPPVKGLPFAELGSSLSGKAGYGSMFEEIPETDPKITLPAN